MSRYAEKALGECPTAARDVAPTPAETVETMETRFDELAVTPLRQGVAEDALKLCGDALIPEL